MEGETDRVTWDMIGMLVTASVSGLNKPKFEIWTWYQYPDMNDKLISN